MAGVIELFKKDPMWSTVFIIRGWNDRDGLHDDTQMEMYVNKAIIH